MPDAEVAELRARYRLGVPASPPRGVSGDLLGRGTGASLEFQDRRPYAAGDDLRHLDWRAYARTDQLLVRQFREEIAPRVEVVIDGSRSMMVDGDKATVTRTIVALFVELARAEGFPVRCIRVGADVELVPVERASEGEVAFDGERPLTERLPEALGHLRRGALRFCVSDFLFPADAGATLRPLARESGGLALIQVLGAADERPEVGEALRLRDVETGGSLDLVLDRRAVDGYLARLRVHRDAYAQEARRVGAPFVTVSVREGLRAACDGPLIRAGVLAPR